MSDKIYTVYMHICPNGWVYVGMTRQQPYTARWVPCHYQKCVLFYQAILEFGWKNIQHIVIGQYSTKSEAADVERDVTLQNQGHCYNIYNSAATYKSETSRKYYRQRNGGLKE